MKRRDQLHREQPGLFDGTFGSPSRTITQTQTQAEPAAGQQHAIPLLDPRVDESDFDRLSSQNSAVLTRLRRGT